MSKLYSSRITAAFLGCLLLMALPAPRARAQAVNYAGKTRIVNVGKLIVNSGTYDPKGPLSGVAEDTAPHIFYLMDQRSDLKPRGWILQNPLAPPSVTQGIHDRWVQAGGNPKGIDPLVSHGLRYQIGSPVSKDMAAYWEVNLLQTPLNDLLKFDLLFISSHTPGESFSPQEQQKLRKLVEAGGIVWLDDCWKFRIADSGRFFLPNLQFHGSHVGAANPAASAVPVDPTHPLINSPYYLTQDELDHLGDKNVGEYYHTGYVAPQPFTGTFNDPTPKVAPDLSQPEPDVLAPILMNSLTGTYPGGPYPYLSAGRYGAGFVIVSSGDIGDAINANAGGTSGYNIPAPDYDKNGGSVCGNSLKASDPEDLKFAFNALSWASNFSTYRRGPEHSAYSPQSVSLPVTKQWSLLLRQGEAVESDPIVVRGNIFVATSQGRLLCLMQDPTKVPGAVGPVELWEASPSQGAPLSSLTTTIAGSVELIIVSSGSQMFAYNAAYGSGNIAPPAVLPPSGTPWLATPAAPNFAWTFNIPGGGDTINGAPVSMAGALFITTQGGAVWEIDPGSGLPQRLLAKMPSDPLNPTDVLPATEPILHFANPAQWGYIAAPPAVGWVVDRSTTDDDPTLVLALYTTATQFPNAAAETALDGGLLQFPVKVANEHYLVGDPAGRQLTQGGAWSLPPLKYSAIKNPELATFDANTGVATPVAAGAGTGTMHVTIQWPDGSTSPSYYELANGSAMAKDYNQSTDGVPTPGTWLFLPGNPLGTRLLYSHIVLAPEQYWPGKGQQPLTPDCSVHIDYDVDEGDPFGTPSATSGPVFHPEMAVYDIKQANGVPSGPAVLSAPAIGLDDSVYFGDERGILYSTSYYTRFGAHLLASNWKFYTNRMHWYTTPAAGGQDDLNPVTLADMATNSYTTDIHTQDTDNNVIRSTPTTGNGKLFVTVTDVTTNRSRVMSFDPYESQQSTGASGSGQSGPTLTFQLAPPVAGTVASFRNPINPVSMIAQFNPLTNVMHQFFSPRDFTVDAAAQKVTLLQFGQMYSNLPIYVYYNMGNGESHIFGGNPSYPPDETHNVYPGVNGLPYDPSDKYLYPAPNGSFMAGPAYGGGVPTTPADPSPYPHPSFEFPAEKLCNLLWQFPDPVWNNPTVSWAGGLVYPNWNANGVNWYGPVTSGGPSTPLIQPFTGTAIGSAPTATIADSSPVLAGDSLVLGVSQLFAPGVNATTKGMLVLPADPRSALAAYTDPEGAAIYNYSALQPTVPGSIPNGMILNDPNGVVTNANNLVNGLKGSILAPYPPAVSFYDTQDFVNFSGMISTPALTQNGAVVGSGLKGTGSGAVTLLGAPQTTALDSYRLVGLDPGGNVTFEIPSTTKTSFVGADEPTDEGSNLQDTGQFSVQTLNFNRPSSMQTVDQSNLLIADSGNSRVVECDLGGSVVSEITRFYDPTATYQPGDFYTVAGGAAPTYSVGNGHLSNPTDAYQWSTTNGAVTDTYRLIVDADNFQIVVIADEVYATGPKKGQIVSLPQQVQGPNNTPVTMAAYHIKVWGTKPSPTGTQYRYRTAYPVVVNGQLTAVVATVSNNAFTLKTAASGTAPAAWTESSGASIVVLAGMTSPFAGTIQAAANGFQDLRSDKYGNGHGIQNPIYLRPYQDPNGNTHWLFIDQGAFYTPVYTASGNGTYGLSFNDTRSGNWGVYDLPLTVRADQITGNFSLSADGAMDSVDYANMTTNTATTNPVDLYYSPTQPPAFAPTSAQYLPLTQGILISNGALNLLTDPTLLTQTPYDPKRLLGNGGEVLLIGPSTKQFYPGNGQTVASYNPFFHGAVPAYANGSPSYSMSPDYWPDYTPTPSIQFRSIPVHGSYLLQQVTASSR